jgi:predicted dehydrogenase
MTFLKALPTSRVKPAMQAPELRWGILGTGWIAGKFSESVKAHTKQTIAAVGSRKQGSADAFAAAWGVGEAYGGYEALVAAKDVDVIYVATPHNMHHEHVRLALEAGKHVLVEKPMALNRAQAADMVALARAKKLFFAEALWTFFLPKFDVLQQVFESGALGEIKSVYTEYGEYLPREHRIFDARLAGGPLLDLGTYPVSLLAKLLGVPRQLVGLGQMDPSGVNGQLSVVLRNEAGSLGAMSTTLYGFTPTNAAIVGTEGTVRFPTEFHLPGSFELRSFDGSTALKYDEPRGQHFDGLYFEAAEVARCIAEGRLETPCRPLDASLETMATLDKIRQCVGIDFAEAGLRE